MEERALTYQALFFRTLQIEGVFPDSNTVTVIALRHTEVKWAADLSDVPASCKAEPEPLGEPWRKVGIAWVRFGCEFAALVFVTLLLLIVGQFFHKPDAPSGASAV
jgi:hypothetical protein